MNGLTAEKRSQGNKTKLARMQLKLSLSSGRTTIAEVLSSVPECAREMPLHELISAVGGVGPARLVSINHDAMSHRVNLFLPVVAVSQTAKKWVVDRVASGTL